ncbi:hypothetical protein XPA_007180 [Xanthoria parietina]
MSGDDEQWNDSNRAFLQALMARSTLTLDEAKPLLAAIQTTYERRETIAEDITEADLNAHIAAANTRISPFDFEIRSTYHQTTRKRVYALVNSSSDPIIQLATIHTAEEISFLKRVLDAMFETYNTSRNEVMAITSMQAVRLHKAPDRGRRDTQDGAATQGSTAQGLKMIEAEKMLRTLVDEGWFETSNKGYYTLSPRALMELRGWLIETYNDVDDDDDDDGERPPRIKQCVACKEIVTVGQRCSKRSCHCRLHDICVQNFFRMQRSNGCPVCKTEWTGDSFVGERAAPRRSGAGSNANTSRITVDDPDQNNDPDEIDR